MTFGDVQKQQKTQKTAKDEDEEALEKEERKKFEDDVFEKIMKKQRDRQSKVDFVAKNMETVQLDPDEKERDKVFKIRTAYVRLESAKSRKDEIEMENMKKRLFLLHRWEILKEKRDEMRVEALQLRMERQRKFEWTRHIYTCLMLRHIFSLFDQERDHTTRQAKVQFAVGMFGIKFKLWSQKKRKTQDERKQLIARE